MILNGIFVINPLTNCCLLYSGDYGDAVTVETLKDFHRRRLQILAQAGPDLIAFETIPNKMEAKVYVEILQTN